MLESYKHASSVFVTLTYDDEHLPEGGSLVPDDLKRFLWRFRKAVRPVRFRYFAVGEYGDLSWRPHYHLVLFGLPESSAPVVQSSWGLGFTSVLPLTAQLAQYCAGYVVKKMTACSDPRLLGRRAEFARMSLRPGLGAAAMEDVASSLSDVHGARLISSLGDCPAALLRGRKSMPLGRYLRRRLRHEMGFAEVGTPLGSALAQKRREEMRVLQARAIERGSSLRQEVVEKQRIASAEARARIYSRKGTF